MRTKQMNLSRRAPWILLCCALVAGAAYGFYSQQTKKYTATASLAFNNTQLAQQIAGLPAPSRSSQQVQQATNLKLVRFGDMAAKTAGLLGPGLTEAEVRSDLSVGTESDSNIVDVSATATSPTRASEIANTYAEQFVIEQRSAGHRYSVAALKVVNKQVAALSAKARAGAAGLALEARAQALSAIDNPQGGTVQLVRSATIPTSPSSPKVVGTPSWAPRSACCWVWFSPHCWRAALTGGSRAGGATGDLRTSAPWPNPCERRPLPFWKAKKGPEKLLPSREAEAFNLIRAHLRAFDVDRQLRTLLVVSAVTGDGKTTVARHLASAAARRASRVLLLEADLRHPTLARQLDVLSGPGVSDVLTGTVSLSEATQMIDLTTPSTDDSEGRVLDVAVAGAELPPNPGELIEGPAMEALLEQAESTYDFVVIDTPPLIAVSDAFPLIDRVDGVVIVSRMGHSRRDVAERLHETLTGAGAPLLGVIANGFRARRLRSYGYAYDYADAGAKQPPAVEVSSNGASPNVVAADAADAASANGTYPPEKSVPVQSDPRMPPTYGEAVDLAGRLGDLPVEPPGEEIRPSWRRRRASRRA